MTLIRANSRLDKYRIVRRLGDGAFANVYEAFDTLEGRRVALKIPHHQTWTTEEFEQFQREVRLAARLDHPNVLSLKNASFIGDYLVMAFPLGVDTLAGRLTRRMRRTTSVSLAKQMMDAVAYAHENRLLHCDIKPENFILFDDNRVRLADFGLAKFVRGTIWASGAGTVGYMAPEQAMGRPTYRSDVFSLGLVLYRMFSGVLPEWPFSRPLPEFNRLRRGINSEMVALMCRAIDPIPSKRFRDGVAMRNAFALIRRPLLPIRARRRSEAMRRTKSQKLTARARA